VQFAYISIRPQQAHNKRQTQDNARRRALSSVALRCVEAPDQVWTRHNGAETTETPAATPAVFTVARRLTKKDGEDTTFQLPFERFNDRRLPRSDKLFHAK